MRKWLEERRDAAADAVLTYWAPRVVPLVLLLVLVGAAITPPWLLAALVVGLVGIRWILKEKKTPILGSGSQNAYEVASSRLDMQLTSW